MSKVDLHIHSNASDGRFSPTEIVRQAAEKGLSIISLTDHDSIEGVASALEEAENYPTLRIIPGIELSTDVPRGEVHVLGYFIDYKNQELVTRLERMRNSRKDRAQKIVAKLAKLGIYIDWPRVQEIVGSASVGRPHIAQAMIEKGYIGSVREAFARYIGREGPAYVPREKITPAESVQLITRANGLPVLGHPTTFENPEALITQLKNVGLAGIECYYDNYAADDIKRLVALAKKYRLIATGGSDFHGLDATETLIGGVEVPIESAEQLIALAGQRKADLSIGITHDNLCPSSEVL